MRLEDIASINGKSGLYKIIKPTRTGVIVESLDEKKNRLVITSTNKVSILHDISIYTTTVEGSVPLKKVLHHLHQQFKDQCPVTTESSSQELAQFMLQLLPDYDSDRVYISDIKKLITWYTILVSNSPETLASLEEKEESNETISSTTKEKEE